MEILIKAAQLILSLSILVIFHEFGHFLFAKLFHTRVEKFYLFFDPWFSLFKFKKGVTEYGVGWVPLGGYVKISGMIDESMDKEQMSKPPQPWEFRSKPSWQRLLIMVGGVLVNFLLAIGIYIMVMFAWGEKYLPTENLEYGIVTDSIAREAGLRNGDKIISVDNENIENFSDILPHILLNETSAVKVKRDGKIVDIDLPKNLVRDIIKSESYFIDIAFPFVVEEFTENSNAEKAGIQKGDRIVGINNQKLPYFSQYPPVLDNHKGEEVILLVERQGDIIDVPVTVNKEGMIGVRVKSAKEFFDFRVKKYGLVSAVPAGINKGYNEIKNYLKQLRLIFNPETEAYKSLGGFIAIGNIFPASWDWYSFWMMTALLSIMLGILNILPIPALDGGHVMFLMYEIIVGRKPSDKFLEYAQITGMILLLSLVVYANGNDIVKLFN
jgi:regulator of sigma E protease